MNRLSSKFAALTTQPRGALLPYITAGYPDLDATISILSQITAPAVACVELGIPFSDPIADGPVIQTSFSRALERGFQLSKLFAALTAASAAIHVPLVAMVSYSIVYRRGIEAFVTAAKAAGIDGLIIPDLALEEAQDVAAIAAQHDCGLILIAAPTTTPQRRAQIAKLSTPWIYYQSVAGVTGERTGLPADLAPNVQSLRAAGNKPVCVGFGISTPQQVRDVYSVADGAIVGSAIVRRMNAASDRGASSAAVADEALAAINALAQMPARS